MRTFIPALALVAAATATQMGGMTEAQSCAMKTLLSSTACNTGDAACLCSDSARTAVMDEIKNACGSEQAQQTEGLASEACRMQPKVRRAYMPSGSSTENHNAQASPSSSASRVNGAQQCSCANNTPANNNEDPDKDKDDERTMMTSNQGTGSGTGTGHSSRVHAPSMMATPSSSSAARHGVGMTTPSASSSRAAKPSGADAFSPFKGAGVQIVPSLSVVAGGLMAGVVGVFAAL